MKIVRFDDKSIDIVHIRSTLEMLNLNGMNWLYKTFDVLFFSNLLADKGVCFVCLTKLGTGGEGAIKDVKVVCSFHAAR